MKSQRIMVALAILGISLLALLVIGGGASAKFSFSWKYVGNEVVDLEWTPYEEDDFKEYQVYRNDTFLANYTDADQDTFHRDTGLEKGVRYTYTLTVINDQDEEADSLDEYVTTGKVRGVIIQDTSWDEGEYNFSEDGVNVEVEDEATLQIAQGVKVYTNQNRLVVRGALSETVSGVEFHGKGLYLEQGVADMAQVTFSECVFNGSLGGESYTERGTALGLKDLRATVENCSFWNYALGLDIQDYVGPMVKNNSFQDIKTIAIQLTGQNYDIRDNVITDCGQGMVVDGRSGQLESNTVSWCSEGGIQVTQQLENIVELQGNSVQNCGNFGINITGPNFRLIDNMIIGNPNIGLKLVDVHNGLVEESNISQNGGGGVYVLGGDNNTFRNCDLMNNEGDAGIHLSGSHANILEFLDVTGNELNGIKFSSGGWGNIVRDSTFQDNGVGISATGVREFLVRDNTIQEHENTGVQVMDGRGVTLVQNDILENKVGAFLFNVSSAEIHSNTIDHNTDGISLNATSYVNLTNHDLQGNGEHGVMASFSHHLVVDPLSVSGSEHGIFLEYCEDIWVANLTATNNDNGLTVRHSTGEVDIWNNQFTENNDNGIFLYKARWVLVRENDIHENSVGVTLSGTTEPLEGTRDSEIMDNSITENVEKGVYFLASSQNRLENNSVEATGNHGIQMEASSGNVIKNNTVNNGSILGVGIHLWQGSHDNELSDNLVSGNRDRGIFVQDSQDVVLLRNRVILNGNDGIQFKDSSRGVVRGNNISGNLFNGLYFNGEGEDPGEFNVQDNFIFNNNKTGLLLEDVRDSAITHNNLSLNNVGMLFGGESTGNQFKHNVLFEDTEGEVSWALIVEEDAQDNVLENITVWVSCSTVIYIPSYQGSFQIRGVADPPVNPQPPEYRFKQRCIQKLVEVATFQDNSWVYLEFHYQDEDLFYGPNDAYEIPEETLMVWRYGKPLESRAEGDRWLRGNEEDYVPWNGTEEGDRILDLDNNIVGVKIKAFSIFAPLGGYPVHNMDTDLDFLTIQDALDDAMTLDGHLIVVDAPYAGTKENIQVSKSVTIRSSFEGSELLPLQAKSISAPAITLGADNILLENFSITGSTGNEAHGLSIANAQGVVVRNCSFTGNYYGLGVEGGQDQLITLNTFSGNLAFSIRLQNAKRTEVTENVIRDDVGIFAYNLEDAHIHYNDFLGNSDYGFNLQGGSGNQIEKNNFTSNEVAIYVRNTRSLNTISDNYIEAAEKYGFWLSGAEQLHVLGGLIENTPIAFYLESDSKENTLEGTTIQVDGARNFIGVEITDSDDNLLKELFFDEMTSTDGSILGVLVEDGSTGNLLQGLLMEDLKGTVAVVGIHLTSTDNVIRNCLLRDFNASGEVVGIKLEEGHRSLILDNEVTEMATGSGEGVGILFTNTRSSRVRENLITDNEMGIKFESNSQVTVNWNQIMGNIDGLNNSDDEVEIDATNNWWGTRKGPSGVGPGEGDRVGLYILYEPWIGASFTHELVGFRLTDSGVLDGKGSNHVSVEYTGAKGINLTTLLYEDNPGANFFGDLGKYVDVHLEGDTLTQLEIRLYYSAEELDEVTEAELELYWWDGEFWQLCSETGVEIAAEGEYAGYVWALVRADTSPSFEELKGTPFAAGDSGFVTHRIVVEADPVEGIFEPESEVTFTGSVTVEPEGTIHNLTIFLDGAFMGEAEMDGTQYNGSFTLPVDLAVGWHDILTQLNLDTGENGTVNTRIYYEPVVHTIDVTIDEVTGTVAPQSAITVKGDIIVTPNEDVQKVLISVDGTLIGEAALITGDFTATGYTATVTLPANLAEGISILTVRVELVTGEFEEKTGNIEYDPDTVDRAVVIDIDPIDQGQVEPGKAITISGNVTITPAGEVDSVEIYLNGDLEDVADYDGGAFFVSLTLPTDLGKEKHEITVNIILESGQEEEESVEFTNTRDYVSGGGGDEDSGNMGAIIIMVVVLLLVAGIGVVALVQQNIFSIGAVEDLLDKMGIERVGAGGEERYFEDEEYSEDEEPEEDEDEVPDVDDIPDADDL